MAYVRTTNGWPAAVQELAGRIVEAGSEVPTVDTLVGASDVGKDVMKAPSQSAARSAIGAGTSSLAIGTTASTAKAGNYQPTWAQVTGKPTTFAPVIGTSAADAKAGNWTPTIAQVTGLQDALNAITARLDALEAETP